MGCGECRYGKSQTWSRGKLACYWQGKLVDPSGFCQAFQPHEHLKKGLEEEAMRRLRTELKISASTRALFPRTEGSRIS